MRELSYSHRPPSAAPLDDLPDQDLRAALAWLRARIAGEKSWPLSPGVRGLIRVGRLEGRRVGSRFIGEIRRGGRQ
jgi:hypothetical protein